jgi:phosphoribosyl-ATP pyrophosphohydrolase
MNKDILFKLADLIKNRRLSNREDSYVKSLLEDGTKKINEKIFEEALELIEASLEDNEAKKKKVIHEMADLWFHTMVLLENEGLELEDILSELETRFGTSGHEEKSSR